MWSLTYRQSDIVVANVFLEFCPQNGGKNQLAIAMECIYITVTLCIINESLLLRITGHFLAIVCDIVVLQSHVALQSLYYSHQKQTHILVVAPYGPQGCKYRSWLAAQLNIQHPCRILPLKQRFSLRPYEFCCVVARWSLFAKCCTNTEYCTDVL